MLRSYLDVLPPSDGEQPRYDAGDLAATDETTSADPPRFGEQAYRPPRLDDFRASFDRAIAKRNRRGGAGAAPSDALPDDDETAEREARKVQQMMMMRERVRESYAAVRKARYAAAAQRQKK